MTRTDPPIAADEATTLTAYLDYQRATLALKVAGLTDAQLRTTHPPSSLTLAGLVNHLALVEDWWFATTMGGQPTVPPFDGVDWDADPDYEFRTALEEPGEVLMARWQAACERSRTLVASLLAGDGLEATSVRVAQRIDPGGRFSLRWVILHMVEEYARHNGHADLLREAVDGVTGE